jgi:CHASE3 domain sensor protein
LAHFTHKLAIHVAVLALITLASLNAYLGTKHLTQIHNNLNLRLENARIQADISSLLIDLDDLESGERGYLLTDNTSYLQPYTNASGRLEAHFATLRSSLASRPTEERLMVAQAESLVRPVITDFQEGIWLLEHGYRTRAVAVVKTDGAKDSMDQARKLLFSLSSAESTNADKYSNQTGTSSRTAVTSCLLLSLAMLLVTVVMYSVSRRYTGGLEFRAAQKSDALQEIKRLWEDVATLLTNDFRELLADIRRMTDGLVEQHGAFLPRKAEENVQCIKQQVSHMDRLIEDVLSRSPR